MKSLLIQDCTRALDTVIAEERARYAAERVDYHEFFYDLTIPQVQKIVRREPVETDSDTTRKEVVESLFHAQQHAPHRLWELLLLQSAEAVLVKRRRALSRKHDERLDAIVIGSFLVALENIPFKVSASHTHLHVYRVSQKLLTEALREARGAPPRKKRSRKGAR